MNAVGADFLRARSVAFWWKALRTVQMVGMQAERFDIALEQLERGRA